MKIFQSVMAAILTRFRCCHGYWKKSECLVCFGGLKGRPGLGRCLFIFFGSALLFWHFWQFYCHCNLWIFKLILITPYSLNTLPNLNFKALVLYCFQYIALSSFLLLTAHSTVITYFPRSFPIVPWLCESPKFVFFGLSWVLFQPPFVFFHQCGAFALDTVHAWKLLMFSSPFFPFLFSSTHVPILKFLVVIQFCITYLTSSFLMLPS